MAAANAGSEAAPMNQTTMDRTSGRELVITRAFNGPARIVFDAWTRPELVRRWWAPQSRHVVLVSCDADVRTGGWYRYVMRHATHGDMAFSGKYREVTPHSRLVHTEVFEPTASGSEEEGAVVTVTFEERGGKTHVVSHSLFPSSEVLDAVIATGMEGGMRESMDQLDALVASLVEQ
jgi:uncharacterized protein YndB with AHSA1/START domain